MPNLSCDAVPDYASRLRAACARFEDSGEVDTESLRTQPSILFGLETAVRHAMSGSFALWPTPFSRGEAGIPINGLIWMADAAEMARQIEDKLTQGFRCLKLKIGAIDFDDELALLTGIRRRFSRDRVVLRVDANGAFSVAEAMEKLERLAELDIHSIEQPIRAGQWRAMEKLAANAPLPIALDEELIGVHAVTQKEELLDTVHPRFIVLKPSLHGGMRGCAEWIALAEARGIGWWVTSALESNIGLNAIAQWTASLNVNAALPQGLGAGTLFTGNVPMPLSVENGRLWFDPARLPDA
ncbi:MAG: o-succinylbenzoate synthase [Zoogloeaceae bacterium]|nr:o-succinylbenzoate synthase [Zoogloeaceae bacterium]